MTRSRLFPSVLAALVVAVGACGHSHVADFEGPTALTRMEIRVDQNELAWRIDAKENRLVRAVDYGAVPDGFVQVFPTAGRPRPLRDREPVLLVYTTTSSWTRHEGRAIGDSAFKGGFWESGPLARTTPEKVFINTPMPISLVLRQ